MTLTAGSAPQQGQTPFSSSGCTSVPSCAASLVQAETCDVCKAYLKLIRRDKDAAADPVADDLATLALDILVDESGFSRSGPNLLLVPGGG